MEDRVKDKYRKTMVTTQEPIYYNEETKEYEVMKFYYYMVFDDKKFQ